MHSGVAFLQPAGNMTTIRFSLDARLCTVYKLRKQQPSINVFIPRPHWHLFYTVLRKQRCDSDNGSGTYTAPTRRLTSRDVVLNARTMVRKVTKLLSV
jgi:hypothetical protein